LVPPMDLFRDSDHIFNTLYMCTVYSTRLDSTLNLPRQGVARGVPPRDVDVGPDVGLLCEGQET
jgi:hypothetical protein